MVIQVAGILGMGQAGFCLHHGVHHHNAWRINPHVTADHGNNDQPCLKMELLVGRLNGNKGWRIEKGWGDNINFPSTATRFTPWASYPRLLLPRSFRVGRPAVGEQWWYDVHAKNGGHAILHGPHFEFYVDRLAIFSSIDLFKMILHIPIYLSTHYPYWLNSRRSWLPTRNRQVSKKTVGWYCILSQHFATFSIHCIL